MKTTDKLSSVVPFETSDGSTTLYDSERDIHYRSHHGAASESRHVFLEGTGLIHREKTWRVAELGFGAAVNFTQTVQAFRKTHIASKLIYHSIDWRPVTADHLLFHKGEGGELAREAVARVHKSPGQVATIRSEDRAIELHLHPSGWEHVDMGDFSAQAFFQDPFSIRVNPEAWTGSYFAWARSLMDDDARLATYSAASAVKKAIFEGHLWAASAPGPGRKREMTVAAPTKEALAGLKILDRDRYINK